MSEPDDGDPPQGRERPASWALTATLLAPVAMAGGWRGGGGIFAVGYSLAFALMLGGYALAAYALAGRGDGAYRGRARFAIVVAVIDLALLAATVVALLWGVGSSFD